MHKPIEPGCLAMVFGMVVDVEFNGVCVRVERRKLKGELIVEARSKQIVPCRHEDLWECGVFGLSTPALFHGRNLMRIDEHDSFTDETEQEVRDDAPAHA